MSFVSRLIGCLTWLVTRSLLEKQVIYGMRDSLMYEIIKRKYKKELLNNEIV